MLVSIAWNFSICALASRIQFAKPGQHHDAVGVADLIEGWEFDGIIASMAFDAGWIIAGMERRSADIVISQHPNRTAPGDIDKDI